MDKEKQLVSQQCWRKMGDVEDIILSARRYEFSEVKSSNPSLSQIGQICGPATNCIFHPLINLRRPITMITKYRRSTDLETSSLDSGQFGLAFILLWSLYARNRAQSGRGASWNYFFAFSIIFDFFQKKSRSARFFSAERKYKQKNNLVGLCLL